MTRRLTENSAIMVRMLASRCRILKRTLRVAVTIPEAAPASMARPVATHGFHSARISVAATAAPSGKLPSTVRSGKSRTRKDRKTPKATRANTSPSSAAPSSATALIASAPTDDADRHCPITFDARATTASGIVTPIACAAFGLT